MQQKNGKTVFIWSRSRANERVNEENTISPSFSTIMKFVFSPIPHTSFSQYLSLTPALTSRRKTQMQKRFLIESVDDLSGNWIMILSCSAHCRRSWFHIEGHTAELFSFVLIHPSKFSFFTNRKRRGKNCLNIVCELRDFYLLLWSLKFRVWSAERIFINSTNNLWVQLMFVNNFSGCKFIIKQKKV